MCDNQPAIHMMHKWNTRSWACRTQLLAIINTADALRVFLTPLWVPSRDTLADAPSRQLLQHVFTVPRWVASLIRQRFAPCRQLFIAGQQLARECVPLWDSWALTQLSEPGRVFIFPPLRDVLLGQLAAMLS